VYVYGETSPRDPRAPLIVTHRRRRRRRRRRHRRRRRRRRRRHRRQLLTASVSQMDVTVTCIIY